jgi:hypothetical protein
MMIKVQIDEEKVKEIYLEEVNKKIKELDTSLVLWDTKELRRRTCMSWTAISNTFLHDQRFPKYKVGTKWYFPAREAEEFILKWIKEQGA